MAKGEWTITGIRAANLQQALNIKPGKASYLIKRMRLHGLIKKVGRQYKYYLTKMGCRIITAALIIRQKLFAAQPVPDKA